MEGRSDPGSDPGSEAGPVYIYNGASNLRELRDVKLSGANLFFNGSFSIEDLQEVDLQGATVFLNGQSHPTSKAQPSTIEACAVVASQSSSTDAKGTAKTDKKHDPTTSDVRLVIRRPLELSSIPALELSGIVAEKGSERLGDERKHQSNDGTRFPDPRPSNRTRDDSKDRASISVPRNPKYTPVGPIPRLASQSVELLMQNPSPPSGLFLSPALSPQIDTLPVVMTHVPSEPLSHRKAAQARRRRTRSARFASPKSTSSTFLSSKRWTHDLAPSLLSPPKRPSSAHTNSYLVSDNKKPRLQKYNSFELYQETDKMIEEELRRSEHTKRSSGIGNDQAGAAQYEKRRKLSMQGKSGRSGTDSLLNTQTTLQSHTTSPFNKGNAGSSLAQMASLPRNSPLNNIINLASLEEEIVQARLKFRLAEKELIQEKARYGSASRGVGARVTALNGKLAALKKQRFEIGNDAQRMLAFRKGDIEEDPVIGETRNSRLTPKSPSPSPRRISAASHEISSPTSDDWKDRLTLCYEALDRSEPYHEMVKGIKSESGTLSADEGLIIKQEEIGERHLPGMVRAEDRTLAVPPQRRVQFALTDVETFL